MLGEVVSNQTLVLTVKLCLTYIQAPYYYVQVKYEDKIFEEFLFYRIVQAQADGSNINSPATQLHRHQ